ncbi:MAG: kelch repeat-containing protein, partial [Myxococcota bacterium]
MRSPLLGVGCFVLLLSGSLWSGCSVELTTPDDIMLECAADTDCPDGWACNQNNGLCTPSDDRTPPTLLNLRTTKASSVYMAGEKIGIAFEVTEAPGSPVAARLLVEPPEALTCRTTGDLAYECLQDRILEDTDPEGVVVVELVVEDVARNEATALIEAVVDHTSPTLTESVLLAILPDAGNALVRLGQSSRITLLTADSIAAVMLVTDEPSLSGPAVQAEWRRALTAAEARGTVAPSCCSDAVVPNAASFSFSNVQAGVMAYDVTYTITAALDNGCFCVEAEIDDLAGNIGTLALGSLGIDTVEPRAPDVTTNDRIILHRSPWEPNPLLRLRLTGALAAVEGSTTVGVYSGPVPANALLLDETVAETNGSFTVDFVGSDIVRAYLSSIDAAGNESTVSASRDGRWTADLAGKQRERSFENPHLLWTTTRALASNQLLPEASQSDIDAVAAPGEQEALTSSVLDWRRLPDGGVPGPRPSTSIAFDSRRGELVLFGGTSADSSSANSANGDTWLWNEQNGWRQGALGAQKPAARTLHAMVYDRRRDEVILHGGTSDLMIGPVHDDTWAWDGTAWTERAASGSGPSPRVRAAIAYHPVTGETLLFGGCLGTLCDSPADMLNDTWVWDGAVWRQASPSQSPSPRFGAALGYDPPSGDIILFGGCDFFDFTVTGDCNAALADTWAWGNDDWVQLSPATVPEPRWGHHLSYGERDQAMVMFGDFDPARACSAPTCPGCAWHWKNGDWTRAATQPPPTHGWVARDPNTDRLLLFGGRGVCTGAIPPVQGGPFVWDGSEMVSHDAGPITPSPRLAPAIVYDARRQRTVFFGGYAGLLGYNCQGQAMCDDTWELIGDRWEHVPAPMAP